METKWLEDLVALSQARNLLQAAQARNVTHPAFGRRIKALEEWAGVPLTERGHQTVTLNAAGRSLLTAAVEVLDILRETRQSLHRPEQERARRIVIASGKTLAHSVLPDLLAALKRGMSSFSIKVHTTTLNYGIDMLVDGEVDFLLCHAHEPIYVRIDNPDFRYRRVGSDKLVAVSAPAAPGTRHPKYPVPRDAADAAVPFLAYADSMSLGQILRDRLRGLSTTSKLETAYESDLADSLHAMAQQGFGLAWLPHTLIEKDLQDGTLVRADSPRNDIQMEIRLYQSVNMARPLARELWARVEAYSAPVLKPGSAGLAGNDASLGF